MATTGGMQMHQGMPLVPQGKPQFEQKTLQPRPASASTTQTTRPMVNTSADEDEDEAADDEAADVCAPSSALGRTKQKSLMGPMKNAGNGPATDAVAKMISELQANGWRPEEEAGIADDDDYNDVDLISESDETEHNMRKLEESMMVGGDGMDPVEEDALARRLSLASHGSDDIEYDFGGEGMYDSAPLESYLALDQPAPHFLREATPLVRKDSEETTAAQRRVRFEDELDGSDVASTDDERVNEEYPDLFIQHDHLNSAFQLMIDDDAFLDDGSDAGSCWDFEGDETRIDFDDDDKESDVSASSGEFDSDEGDTTDEEMPPHPSTVPKLTAKETSPASSSSSAATKAALIKAGKKPVKVISKRTSPPHPPKSGTFVMDPQRPVLLVEGSGKSQRNMYYPAKVQSKADRQFWLRLQGMYNERNTSPRMSIQLTPGEETEVGGNQMFDVNSPNAVLDGFGSLRPEQIVGPPEAFMPFTNIDITGNITEENGWQGSDDDEEDEPDFLELLDFGESEEDEEMRDESDAVDSPSLAKSSPFPYLSAKGGSGRGGFGTDLLAHLDRNRGLVGSFRRNQQYAKQVGSLPSHPGVRASTSEMNAIQTGRRAAGNAPITPLRKKRGGKAVGARTSPISSPLPKAGIKKKGPSRGGFSARR